MLRRFPILTDEFINSYMDHFRRIFPGLIYAIYTVLQEKKISRQTVSDLLDDMKHIRDVELFLDSFPDEAFEELTASVRKEGAKYHSTFSAKSYLQDCLTILDDLIEMVEDLNEKATFDAKGEVDPIVFLVVVNYLLGKNIQEFVGEEAYNETVFGDSRNPN